ncbi:MAG: hypothetical protein CM1200mP29_17770 [Verrucomicrobiota bacterium]|nr:MAG: hypothetical protein CM1200mP29_17770 [Verrucomicrobiota bacterium]
MAGIRPSWLNLSFSMNFIFKIITTYRNAVLFQKRLHVANTILTEVKNTRRQNSIRSAFLQHSGMCSRQPAPPLATTGTSPDSLMRLVISKS